MTARLANIFWPQVPELDTAKGAEHLRQSGRNMLQLAAAVLGLILLLLAVTWAVQEGAPVFALVRAVWDYLVFVHWFAVQVNFNWYLIGAYVTLETCRYLRVTIGMFQVYQRDDLAGFDPEKLDEFCSRGAGLFRVYVAFLLLHFIMILFSPAFDIGAWRAGVSMIVGALALLAPAMVGCLLLPSEIKQVDVEGLQPQLTLFKALKNRFSVPEPDVNSTEKPSDTPL